jgi:hypothetical protein
MKETTSSTPHAINASSTVNASAIGLYANIRNASSSCYLVPHVWPCSCP